MNKSTIIFNLIISSISLVQTINETTTSQNIDVISENIVEAVSIQSRSEEDVSGIMSKGDILSTSEINEDNTKDFFVTIRYLKEPDLDKDETLIASTKNDSPTTSSIKIHINTLEENSSKNSDSETKIVNEDENNENRSSLSKNAKEISETETTAETLGKKAEAEDNDESAVRGENKSNVESVNSKIDFDEDSNKEHSEFKKSKDEPNFNWDVVDDLSETTRVTSELNDSILDTKARSEEKKVEQVEVTRISPTPENIASAKNKNYDKDRTSRLGNVRLPHTNTGPPRSKSFYNPGLNILRANPVDVDAITNNERNILENNRFMPFTRRNNFQVQDVDITTELPGSVTDDFNSEQYSNAYPYTPLIPPQTSQESVATSRYDSLLLKLIQASEISRNRDNFSRENTKSHKGYFNTFKPKIVIPPNFGLFKIVRI